MATPDIPCVSALSVNFFNLPENKIKRHAHCAKFPCLPRRFQVFQLEISRVNGYVDKLSHFLDFGAEAALSTAIRLYKYNRFLLRGLEMVKTLAATDNSPAQLLIRLALGVVIFPHGAQKVLGWFGGPGYGATVTTFSALGFPFWAIILLMVSEVFGSLLLVFGLFTRVWALAIGAAIAICLKMNHLQHGFFMNWFGQQQGEGYEYHLLVLGIALALVVRGGGMLSLDRMLARDKRRGGLVF